MLMLESPIRVRNPRRSSVYRSLPIDRPAEPVERLAQLGIDDFGELAAERGGFARRQAGEPISRGGAALGRGSGP